MANFTTFNCFTADTLSAKHNIGTSVYKVMLTNTAPVVTNTVKSNITEIAAANGYSAGGPTTTVTQASTGTTATVKASNVTVTATGAVGPFRYAVLYNSTNNALVGFVDNGSAVTMANTDTFAVDFDQTNGVLTVG